MSYLPSFLSPDVPCLLERKRIDEWVSGRLDILTRCGEYELVKFISEAEVTYEFHSKGGTAGFGAHFSPRNTNVATQRTNN